MINLVDAVEEMLELFEQVGDGWEVYATVDGELVPVKVSEELGERIDEVYKTLTIMYGEDIDDEG